MSALKNNDAMLAVVLVIGAMMYVKSPKATAAPRPNTGGQGSMPGNIGTGPAQAIGGALGNWLTGMFGGNNYRAPTTVTADGNAWDDAYKKNPEFMDNVTEYGI